MIRWSLLIRCGLVVRRKAKQSKSDHRNVVATVAIGSPILARRGREGFGASVGLKGWYATTKLTRMTEFEEG